MRLWFFAEVPGLAVSTQLEMAKRDGHTDNSPAWTDKPKTFPKQRDRMLKAIRRGAGDEIWVASLAILASGRADMRHVVLALERLGAGIVEGAAGWTLRPPYEQGFAIAHCWDVWSKRRKILDDPRGDGRATRVGAKGRRMPDAEARPIWFDPVIPNNHEAIAKMNADPRYKREWTWRTAYQHFGASGRPPGQRPKPAKPDPV